MKKYKHWARHNPIQNFGVLILTVVLLNFLFWAVFNWDFTWKDVLVNSIALLFVEVGFRSWHKYEKDNNVTTVLYKDRKKAEAAAQ